MLKLGRNMEFNGDFLAAESEAFMKKISVIKNKAEIDWYPYGILHNFQNLKNIFNSHPLDSLASKRIYDIGAADGDLAFFLESLGYQVTCIENKATNFNRAKGLEHLKKTLFSKVEIEYLDIEAVSLNFANKSDPVDLTFFLGIFYHLQNPLQALTNLSKNSKYLVFSTRLTQFADGVDISKLKVAYLVGPDELNHDDTNWWIFTKPGLFQAFERTGWELMNADYVGDIKSANPVDSDHDLRIYALLKSRYL